MKQHIHATVKNVEGLSQNIKSEKQVAEQNTE